MSDLITKTINATPGWDAVTDTIVETAGYFSDGTGKQFGSNLYSGSADTTNDKYYFNLCTSASTGNVEFSVAYGHYAGSGSYTAAQNIKGASEAVYGQFASMLLHDSEITGGFRISSNGGGTKPTNSTLAAGKRDEYIYVLAGKRARYKHMIDPKNWTLVISGTNTAGAGIAQLSLTDDSATQPAVSTPAGLRYNIVMGTNGTVTSASSARTFGWIYPERGVLVFSGAELSQSIPGAGIGKNDGTPGHAVAYLSGSQMGFGPKHATNKDMKNAVRFFNCLSHPSVSGSSYMQFRSHEAKNSVSYFVRATSGEFNYTNNPTWASGSYNEIANDDMIGNPQVYIAQVGLYDAQSDLIAIGSLSTPVKKNFQSETTIKVKFDY